MIGVGRQRIFPLKIFMICNFDLELISTFNKELCKLKIVSVLIQVKD